MIESLSEKGTGLLGRRHESLLVGANQESCPLFGQTRPLDGEEHGDLGPKAEVLRSLADVKLERRLAVARSMRGQAQQHVLQPLAAQLFRERRFRINFRLRPC